MFNIVFHNEAFGRVFNLFEAFVFATHFKIAVVDAEIGHRRRIHLMLNACLIEEKGFPDVPHILILVAQLLHQIGVFEIDFINFPPGAHSTRFASQLSNYSGFFHVEEVIGDVVPADFEHRSDFAYIGFERHNFRYDGHQLFQFSYDRYIHFGIVCDVDFRILNEVLDCNPYDQSHCLRPSDRCIDRISLASVQFAVSEVLA